MGDRFFTGLVSRRSLLLFVIKSCKEIIALRPQWAEPQEISLTRGLSPLPVSVLPVSSSIEKIKLVMTRDKDDPKELNPFNNIHWFKPFQGLIGSMKAKKRAYSLTISALKVIWTHIPQLRAEKKIVHLYYFFLRRFIIDFNNFIKNPV